MTRIKVLNVAATLAAQGQDPLQLATYTRVLTGLRRLSPEELIRRIPEASRFATLEPDEDWGNLDPDPPATEHWHTVATRIQQLLDTDPGLGGIILVHGTNTLEETAYFLHLVLKTDKPVVVVGAQRPITGLSTDGPLNFVNAVRVATCADASGRGVLVLLNDEIHCARDVSKTNTYRVQTFRALGWGPVGYADPDRIVFHYRSERAHTTATPFTVGMLKNWPRVDILYSYHGDDGVLVEAALAAGARGLVIAGVGAGSPGGMRPALDTALARGVVVVRASRTGSGRVLHEDNAAFPGTIGADDLNPQKARVLLQLALMLTRDPGEIRRFFDTL
jgi:L-asparaginase